MHILILTVYAYLFMYVFWLLNWYILQNMPWIRMSLPQKLCRSAAACQCFVLTLCKGATCNPYMNHIYIYIRMSARYTEKRNAHAFQSSASLSCFWTGGYLFGWLNSCYSLVCLGSSASCHAPPRPPGGAASRWWTWCTDSSESSAHCTESSVLHTEADGDIKQHFS